MFFIKTIIATAFILVASTANLLSADLPASGFPSTKTPPGSEKIELWSPPVGNQEFWREQTALNLVDDLKRIESTIRYDVTADPYFGYVKGSIPVLISAPHGAKHYRTRENRLKGEDAYTGAMAIKLGQITGAHVLYVKNRAFEDPNNDYHTQYKDFLGRVVKENHIRFVMDLHGADGARPFSLDVGTFSHSPDDCSCPEALGVISKALSDLDGAVFNRRFTARGRGTVTYFARRHLGIEAAQFEINARYRVPATVSSSSAAIANAREIDSVLNVLKNVVLTVSKDNNER